MTDPSFTPEDQDLTPRFRWRWNEHGIYLAVCGAIALFVAVLEIVHMTGQRRFDLSAVDLIPVRYIASASEPLSPQGSFRDPRLLSPARPSQPQPARAM
jgi:hypothetical protein